VTIEAGRSFDTLRRTREPFELNLAFRRARTSATIRGPSPGTRNARTYEKNRSVGDVEKLLNVSHQTCQSLVVQNIRLGEALLKRSRP